MQSPTRSVTMWVAPVVACLLAVSFGCATKKEVARKPMSFETTQPVRAQSVDKAIADGVAFILKTQNADGSWGSGLQTRGIEIFATVPGSHDSFRGGTTALCVIALREARDRGGFNTKEVEKAYRKGLGYIAEARDALRENGMVFYNMWAHIYSVQAIAAELMIKEDPELRAAAEWHLKKLESFASYNGGWNYYDFAQQTQQPSMEATSFGTAAALVALHDARAAKLPVKDELIRRAIARLEECRTPGGFFLYGADSRYMLTLPANKLKGAVGRTQSCNDALWTWNSKLITKERVIEGLKLLKENHEWLAMGRKRPLPHEAWYQTSGYYYYFGHYYAARLVEKIDGDAQREYAQAVMDWVLPYQEEDGSWWDYAMWDYHKPYGTAYAVMTLLRCRDALN